MSTHPLCANCGHVEGDHDGYAGMCDGLTWNKHRFVSGREPICPPAVSSKTREAEMTRPPEPPTGDVLAEAGIAVLDHNWPTKGDILVRRADLEEFVERVGTLNAELSNENARLITERDEARASDSSARDALNRRDLGALRSQSAGRVADSAPRNSVGALELLGMVWLQRYSVLPAIPGFVVEDRTGAIVGRGATPFNALLEAYDLLRGEAEDKSALRVPRPIVGLGE